MIKRFFSLFFIMIIALSLSAETKEKTILFLVPFYSNSYDENQVAEIHEPEDFQSIKSFQLFGFWAGAQVALAEYAEKGVPLNIIVKDVSESETKLKSIMENKELMSKVDLIIGPFFSKHFAIAANYAKEYKIPIVNPFSNRTDFLNNNEYVYKLIPSKDSRPATLAFWADQFPQHKIIIHADTSGNRKTDFSYIQYFKKNNIPYTFIGTNSNISNQLSPNGKNIVISLISETARNMMMIRDIMYNSKLDNLVLVIPEGLLESNTLDIEYFSKLNVHFFSDFYVDYANEQTQVFIHNFNEKFKTVPTLENFAFQGYDITRYFVELIENEMDVDRVKIEPIAYRLSFDKMEKGGYENVNTQFLEVKDNEVRQAGF